jgi:hypothetical protein
MAAPVKPDPLLVPRVPDGEPRALPLSDRWTGIEPLVLEARTEGCRSLSTHVRVGWSARGLWIAFEGEDERLTSTFEEDFAELWTEDVFEVFLWPDESVPAYFEYEISPRGRELPLMVLNVDGRFHGWRPWPYGVEHRVKRSVAVLGEAGVIERPVAAQAIASWHVELFVPFSLLTPLLAGPPEQGARWRANFYRVDHDTGRAEIWSWQPTGSSFHRPTRFGHLELG